MLGLTWDAMDISEEAIAANRAYVYINKEVERVSKQAVEELNSKDIILIFPSQKKNNKTVRVLKSPKADSSKRKVFIPKSVAQCLIELKKDQEEIIEALGNEYQNYNLVMATTFGLPIGDSYLRTKMQDIIDELGLPDVVFHSLRHTSVTYKLKLSGGDIKAVQGDSSHAQADMVTEVYGHILDEDRRKNVELMENAFYNKENLNPQMKAQDEGNSTITVPDQFQRMLYVYGTGMTGQNPFENDEEVEITADIDSATHTSFYVNGQKAFTAITGMSYLPSEIRTFGTVGVQRACMKEREFYVAFLERLEKL